MLSKAIKRLVAGCLATVLVLLLLPTNSSAADLPVTTDCVIQNFVSDFTFNKDASLDIKEDLTVDCGNLYDKHGIFRILPTKISRPDKQYPYTPITLKAITDFNGNKYGYQTINNRRDNTLTWKIGDANKTITGINYYRITYHVANAVEYGTDQDRLFWNLNGNFWELEIAKFSANVHFPEGINKNNTTLNLFSGAFGAEDNQLATSSWTNDTTLNVISNTSLAKGEGITISALFPKNIITTYKPSLLALYGKFLWYLLIIPALWFAYRAWNKYGRDPKIVAPIIVEYEPPLKLPPLELGLLESFGTMNNQYITATIVDLAVKKHITIKEVEKTGIFGGKDWEITMLKDNQNDLTGYEKAVLTAVFDGSATRDKVVMVSDMKNKFYTHISGITGEANGSLAEKKLIDPTGGTYRMVFWFIAAVFVGLTVLYSNVFGFDIYGAITLAIIAIIFAIFGTFMTRRTKPGAEADHKLKGFKMYLEHAEKYRMPFYEKENIFEKYLPYAIAFGLTKQWINALHSMYADRAVSFFPAWYIWSVGSAHSFDSFSSNLDSLSSNMASTIASRPSSSGGGMGGGFSGGGGGGGGGGSW